MGEKFLKTKESRQSFVMWTIASTAVLLVVLIGVIGLWGGAVFGPHPLSSPYWWVNVARVLVIPIIFIGGVVLAFFLLLYGMFFFIAAPEYEYSLRAYAGWYDTLCLKLMAGGRKLMEVGLTPIGRVLAWPFRAISTGVHKWINSGL